MKKLNNKGFTLVELLAVIIILAIVVGISIPAITNIINDSKNNALGVAVDSAEKYITDQHGLMSVNYESASEAFRGKTWNIGTPVTLTSGTDDKLITAMGFSPENVATVNVTILDENGRSCVEVTKIKTTSEYYTTTYFKTDGTIQDDAGTENKSKSCD